MRLIQTIMGRFVRAEQLEECDDCCSVDFVNFQKPDDSLMIGYATSAKLCGVYDDVSAVQETKFYSGVRAFFSIACRYLIDRLPKDPCVVSARFVNFES